MKNALLIYQPYEGYINIGDYIQSLASKQFLGNIDIFLNRERLDEYCGEKVRLIMNGWFMHEPLHWPPSESIEPMFVSFHLNTKAYALLNNGKSLKYFIRYQKEFWDSRQTSSMHGRFSKNSFYPDSGEPLPTRKIGMGIGCSKFHEIIKRYGTTNRRATGNRAKQTKKQVRGIFTVPGVSRSRTSL